MVRKKFHVFHLNLAELMQPDLERLPNTDRSQWLRFRLEESFEFQHRADSSLYWTYVGNVGTSILGVIQRERPSRHHLSPKLGGAEVVSPQWQGAYVLVDPTHHDEGQRVAVEIDTVGTSNALIKSLVANLNADPRRPYQIDVEPLFDGQSFWKFAAKHGGVLNWVAFEFVAPNMWGAESELEKELKKTRETTGAERVDVKMQSSEGVKADSQTVRDGVSYVERGAGRISARSMDGKKYNSLNKMSVTEIDVPLNDEAVESDSSVILELFQKLHDRVLDRDKG